MKEYENMDNEPREAEHFFNSALREAIASGDAMKIVSAVEGQEVNAVTEAISNRLIVRSFLVRQKHQLSALDGEVIERATDEEAIVGTVGGYLRRLDDDFVDSFIDEEGESSLQKLTGDEHFRDAMSQSSQLTVSLGALLQGIDVSQLTSPQLVLDWMQNVRDSIVEVTWEGVQEIREGGAQEQTVQSLRGSIEEAVANIDRFIIGSLPRS